MMLLNVPLNPIVMLTSVKILLMMETMENNNLTTMMN